VYRFNFLNMEKSDSLYNHGMKPLVYSSKRAMNSGTGWHRTGQNIWYYQNNYKNKQGKTFYTLSFDIVFDYSYDDVFLCHFTPYRYSDLRMLIN